MAVLQCLAVLIGTFLVIQSPGDAATCSGHCGFGTFGATMNGGDVSAASNLYRDGLGCGACYQVRCTNSLYCSDKGVTAVITDSGASGGSDFILSSGAFGRMAQTKDAARSLLSQGVVDIEYRRVPCSYPGKNITFRIHDKSGNPHYLAFVIMFEQGQKDITAVLLCETQNLQCKLMDRTYGSVWTTNSPPSGALEVRMLFSGEEDGDETWVVSPNNIPENWKPGDTYDSGVQVNAAA
nr:expansin-like B1 [Ipomoea batatas]